MPGSSKSWNDLDSTFLALGGNSMRSLILTIAMLAALPGVALAGDLHQQADSLFKPRPGRPVTSNDAGSANTKLPATQDTTKKDATKQEQTKQ